MLLPVIVQFALVALPVVGTSTTGQEYVLSPASRTIRPVGIYKTTGQVKSKGHASQRFSAIDTFTLTGGDASVTFDFGKIVPGISTFELSDPSCSGEACPLGNYGLPSFTCAFGRQGLGLVYTELEQFVGQTSDLSIFTNVKDGTLYLPLTTGSYTVPSTWDRGSFRYLTLSFVNTTFPATSITGNSSSLHYRPATNVPEKDLNKYTDFFKSPDDLLNRIWYAGAYTLQLCTFPANTSVDHTYVVSGNGWGDDSTAKGLTGVDNYLLDGAKRDRVPWFGDIGISRGSALVTQNYSNLVTVKIAIQENIVLQDKNALSPTKGYFPYAGSPLGDLLIQFGALVGIPAYGSDTYNLWTIASYAKHVITTKDTAFARANWQAMLDSLSATYKFGDPTTGLFNGTRTLVWGRVGQGGQNTALNVLYFHVLNLLTRLAPTLPANPAAKPVQWTTMASKIKRSANAVLFDSAVGLFKDNTTTAGSTVYPQDGNPLAIRYGLVDDARRETIARALSTRLMKFGTPAPELPGSVSPFISSHELASQFIASPGDAGRALSLMRTQWDYMRQAFSSSTLLEGYAANGMLQYGFYGTANAFISHAHAWSTGPLSSLMEYVVGL